MQHNNSPSGGNGTWLNGAFTDSDIIVILLIVVFFGPTLLLSFLPGARDASAHWLVDHHVLIAATAADAVWTLPGDIAALDHRRLIGVGILALVMLVGLTVHVIARHQQKVQHSVVSGDR
ncbi:hypothetical protein AB0N05_37570 [Nocardia sp. NPDC051030]|uniref:hypothetical protein n=1 Tax=Nocardia sp. NPDC051030 TaxID=3155162 RepID=UPI0034140062